MHCERSELIKEAFKTRFARKWETFQTKVKRLETFWPTVQSYWLTPSL